MGSNGVWDFVLVSLVRIIVTIGSIVCFNIISLWIRWWWRRTKKLIQQQAKQHIGLAEESMTRCVYQKRECYYSSVFVLFLT